VYKKHNSSALAVLFLTHNAPFSLLSIKKDQVLQPLETVTFVWQHLSQKNNNLKWHDFCSIIEDILVCIIANRKIQNVTVQE